MNALIVVENGISLINEKEANEIMNLKILKEQIDKKLKDKTEQILEEMENKGILKVSNEIVGLEVTYIAPSDRESFDSKKLREDNPDLYDEYVKMNPVKSSIRIKLKDGNMGD